MQIQRETLSGTAKTLIMQEGKFKRTKYSDVHLLNSFSNTYWD